MIYAGRLKELFREHIRKNIIAYIVIIVVFIVGITSGALSAKLLGDKQKVELVSSLKVFFQGFGDTQSFSKDIMLKKNLGVNIKTLGIMWILGLTIIGAPFVLLLVFIRGFTLGFTVGFLAKEMSLYGLLFSIAAILPQNLIFVPGIILAGVTALSFASSIFSVRIIRRLPGYWKEFSNFTLTIGCIAILFILAGFIEVYISPILMKAAIPLFIK